MASDGLVSIHDPRLSMLEETPFTPTPLLRSLSKSSPRDPTAKLHPPPKLPAPRTEDDIKVQPQSVQDDQSIWPSDDATSAPAANLSTHPQSYLEDLPAEIQELIAGYVVGRLGSTNSGTGGSEKVIKNWNEHMRHPRRRNVADLALVSPIWRNLIQERLYRHIKVQGTMAAVDECADFFLSSPRLQRYVRHLQLIVPIWQVKTGPQTSRLPPESPFISRGSRVHVLQNYPPMRPTATMDDPVQHEATQIFQLASGNATVEEMLGSAKVLFPDLCALTIEAGHCKRPPKIQYFRPETRRRSLELKCTGLDPMIGSSSQYQVASSELPQLPKVTTLILKGAWNIIRDPVDFALITSAMPALQEFHCSYHSLKPDAYMAIGTSLRSSWPDTLTHLNIGLDGLYTKGKNSLEKWRKVCEAKSHICHDLGLRMPQLESLTYTGRVCHQLFTCAMAARQITTPREHLNTRLKSIDLVVDNVCCDPHTHNDATGIHHLHFIEAFEALIVAAVSALQVYTGVNQMRIRYIDLDSPIPLLNPTFHLEQGRAWGIWSDQIIALLREARPDVKFLGRRGQLGTPLELEEQEEPKRSTSVGYYRTYAHGGVLIH